MDSDAHFQMVGQRIYDRFGVKYLKAEDGVADSELILKSEDGNFLGMPYGGVIFNMADVTAGAALRSLGAMGLTVSGEVRFMRGVPNVQKLLCHAEVRKAGKSIGFVDASVTDEKGLELAALSFVFTRMKEQNVGV